MVSATRQEDTSALEIMESVAKYAQMKQGLSNLSAFLYVNN